MRTRKESRTNSPCSNPIGLKHVRFCTLVLQLMHLIIVHSVRHGQRRVRGRPDKGHMVPLEKNDHWPHFVQKRSHLRTRSGILLLFWYATQEFLGWGCKGVPNYLPAFWLALLFVLGLLSNPSSFNQDKIWNYWFKTKELKFWLDQLCCFYFILQPGAELFVMNFNWINAIIHLVRCVQHWCCVHLIKTIR